MRARLLFAGIALGASVAAWAPEARARGAAECFDAANQAQDLRDEGKLLQAREKLLVCSTKSCPGPVRADCGDWLQDVVRRIPSLVFRASDPSGQDLTDATVSIDGAVVTRSLDGRPFEVDPGAHLVRIEHAGLRPVERKVVVVEGEKERKLAVTLERILDPIAPAKGGPRDQPADPARPVPLGSWLAWGIGAAGLLSFAGFGIKANVDYADLRDSCGARCSANDRDSLQTTMNVADVSLAVAVVGAAVGTLWYLLRPPARPTSGLDRAAR